MMMMDMSSLTILVADPSPYMVKIMRAMLRGFGVARIREACDGAQALEELNTNLIDIAIVDYALTTLNGIELTELLRGDAKSANRFVPIIMVSAYTEKWRIEECRDSGATEFLRKPFSARELYDRMLEVVNNPRPFVRSANYFGPDRRRRPPTGYQGALKRDADNPAFDENGEPQREDANQDDVDALFG